MSMRTNRVLLYLVVLFSGIHCVAQDCAEANLRFAHAFHRAERAAARSRIAVLRIHSELQAVSVKGLDDEIKSSLFNKTPEFTTAKGLGTTQILAVEQLRDQARTLANSAMDVMRRFYPQRYNSVVSVPNHQEQDRTNIGADDCEALAATSDAIAFAAEQWSQLADIAAEQAIELSARRSTAAQADPGPKR
jgi:hypothetical protein